MLFSGYKIWNIAPFFTDCRLWPVQLLQFDQPSVHVLWKSSVCVSRDRQRTSLLRTRGKLEIWKLQPLLSMNLATATIQSPTITVWIQDLSKCLMQFPKHSYVQQMTSPLPNIQMPRGVHMDNEVIMITCV